MASGQYNPKQKTGIWASSFFSSTVPILKKRRPTAGVRGRHGPGEPKIIFQQRQEEQEGQEEGGDGAY